jgi:hypothetical protein
MRAELSGDPKVRRVRMQGRELTKVTYAPTPGSWFRGVLQHDVRMTSGLAVQQSQSHES